MIFLDASSHLYNRFCPLVGWSVGCLVGWSVGRSVGRSVTHLFLRRFLGSFRITAPAQSHATDSAVHTALFQVTMGFFRYCPQAQFSLQWTLTGYARAINNKSSREMRALIPSSQRHKFDFNPLIGGDKKPDSRLNSSVPLVLFFQLSLFSLLPLLILW